MSMSVQRAALEAIARARHNGVVRSELAKHLGGDPKKFHYDFKVRPCCCLHKTDGEILQHRPALVPLQCPFDHISPEHLGRDRWPLGSEEGH